MSAISLYKRKITMKNIQRFFLFLQVALHRFFTLEKMNSSLEMDGTCPDILKVVLGPYVQYCPCEASEQHLGQKQESELQVTELSY